MPTPITLRIGTVKLTGQLNGSPSSPALAALLSLTIRMHRCRRSTVVCSFFRWSSDNGLASACCVRFANRTSP